MAVIGKIRNRMGILLVVFVGVALLAFVLGDLLSSSQYFLDGDKTTVGKINGKTIKYDAFQKRLAEKENFFSLVNQGAALDDETRSGILDETWQEYIDNLVLNPAFEEAGVSVGQLELKDMMGGRFVHPFIQQQFTNPETGAFDANSLQNFLTYISDEQNVPEDQLEEWKVRRAQWTNIENAIEKNRLQTKYQTLLEKGMYVTNKEVERQYAESGDRFNIRYVGKAYSEVADSTVEVSDADLKAAYDENKNRFKSDYAVRGLRYALFDILPTAKDSAALYARIDSIKTAFATSTDDTSFVYGNSDSPANPRYLKKETLSKSLDSAVYNAANGFVYGPYVDGSSYYLAKKMAEKTSADSLKMSIIIIARKNQQGQDRGEVAKELADSTLLMAKSGVDFKALAATMSEDPNAKVDSGKVDWIPYEVPGNPIVDTAFNAAIGSSNLVETPDAYYVVKTEGKTAPTRKVLLAFVAVDIKPSEETVNTIYTSASDFALNNKSVEDFDKAAKSGKYVIRDEAYLRENAKALNGIADSRTMVKWAFENKVGAVSSIEQYGNRYVVAVVTKAWSAGVPTFDELKKDLEPIAKRDKKAITFMEEMRTAAASGNIDQVGSSIQKPVIPATDITFQSYGVPGAGYEPAIIGAAAGAAQGKLVGPFKGVNGVYMVVVDGINKGANPPASAQQKADMSRMTGQRVFNEAFEALKSYAGVRDMRYKFY